MQTLSLQTGCTIIMSFPISYEIIYSKRKSVAIQIRPDGQVIVRAPYGCPRSFINSFIHQKADWIVKHSAEKICKTRKEEINLTVISIQPLVGK